MAVVVWSRRGILVLALLLFVGSLAWLQTSAGFRRSAAVQRVPTADEEAQVHHGFATRPEGTTEDGGHLEDTLKVATAAQHSPSAEPTPPGPTKGVVMGRLNEDKFNTDWVHDLDDWEPFIYIVDLPPEANSSTGYRTRMNRAHEAMPYLTYIVEHYPEFPDVVAFVHPHRGGRGAHDSAWHTDVPHNDAVTMLATLRTDTVLRDGYVNLRCVDKLPGCPDEIQPWRSPPDPEKTAEHVFPYYYAALFNLTLAQVRERASVVAQPCCAQFAVSKQQILARPRAEYEHFVRFLEDTVQDGHADETAGRVMEYMWHVVFGKEHVFCPKAVDCYCDVYGRFCPP